MIRVNVVAEGQSEMFFAKGPLNQYFGGRPSIDSRCVLTSRSARNNYEYRGGLISYQQAKNDIVTWLKQDPSAYITTMFDFFRLPNSFPEYQKAMSCQNHMESVLILEEAMKKDLASSRFIPYIQLHEFEALLFSDIQVLKYEYLDPESIAKIDSLYAATKDIGGTAMGQMIVQLPEGEADAARVIHYLQTVKIPFEEVTEHDV